MRKWSVKLITMLCAVALLAAMVPLSALPVSAGKALPHRSETTLMEKILERDGFIEGIWFPWLTHTYLGCGLTSNELAAQWLNGWSGGTNCWYDFSKVGIDEYGTEKIYQEIYNLKSLGYNMMGYEGSIYGEGVIYDDTGDVIGIKKEYLHNVRRLLDICRDVGMPVLWTVCCHTSSVNHYYTNGKAFSDMATRFYADPVVADHYAERFVKPLAKVLAEYPDVVAMVASTSEAENEMNESLVGNQFGSDRDLYGVSQENMLYFVNAVTEAVKAAFPAVPRTICCQLNDMSMYSEVDFDVLGDQNYNWAGNSAPIEGFRSPVPMIVSEFGLGDDLSYADDELTRLQLTFRKNFRQAGYKGCFMWCWSSNSTSGSAYDLLKKGAKNVTDFRDTAYELYHYFEEQRDVHRGDKTVLDTPQLFCNTGNGMVEWIAPRQTAYYDFLRSDDGGKTWIKEEDNKKISSTNAGRKMQCLSEETPTANTVYKIVVRDGKGNEKSSQVSNKASDCSQFNTKYSGTNEEKTYNLSNYPLNLKKVSPVVPMLLTAVSAEHNRPAKAESNLLKEGSFESSAGGFTTSSVLSVVSDKTAPEGSKSLYFNTSKTTTANWHIVWVDVAKNTDYTFSAWVKGAHLSADNRGWATVGVVDSETKQFIPYISGKFPFFTHGKQIVPPGWDEAWHLRSVTFNSGNRTKVGIALYGCSSQMWVDGLALYKNGEGTKYVSDNMSHMVATRFDAEYAYCAEKNSLFKNPTFDSTTFWKGGSGWDSGFLSIANNKYEYGKSLKYTATANPVGQHYLRYVDVQPNTWYTFSVDVKVLKSGAGRLILLDGKMRDPAEIISVEFDGDSFGDDWFTICFRLNTGCFNRLAVGVVDGGGSALIDNLRLFKTSDGIKGDDTYKDPNTGGTGTPPTATARPSGNGSVTPSKDTTTGSSSASTDPSATVTTDPSQGEGTDPTLAPSSDPSQEKNTSTSAPDKDKKPTGAGTQKQPKAFPWLYVGIGGGVLLIGVGVALFLILRKKKQV
ncbi:MAG: hypothetical protein IJB36_04780 [Clostridia bacterium]|nr:hypothetical protein [Clostridia bacterium]